MPDTEVAITELLEIDPERVDAVGSPANGTEWLILKAIDDSETVTDVAGVLAEIEKADDKRPDCNTCDGTGKIKDGHVTCPTCKGSGVKPQPGDTEKSLLALAAAKEAGAAASGASVDIDPTCGHCKGSGMDGSGVCDACAGTGKDAAAPGASELNTVDADAGSVTEGAGGRETVDKAADEDVSKKDMDPNVGGGVDRDKIPAEDFAGKDRSFPIVTQGDVSDALESIGRAGSDNYDAATLKANILKIAKRKGFSVPDSAAEKASGDGTFTAPNAALSDAASQVTDVDPDTTGPMAPPATPGSPAWEAVDAQMATDAALALMTAVELMRSFAQRESTEVAMGEGNDVFDAYATTDAMAAAQAALGVMAQLAFHEGLEAAKSLPDDEIIEKAGRRLAGKTVAALAAARDKAKDLADHIGGVLGDDDPKKNASKSADEIDMAELAKEIENMTTDELGKVLDERDEKLVGLLAEALKSAPAKDAKKSKKDKTEDAPVDEAVKADGEDAEVVAEVETDGDAVTDDTAEKAELTPEEIEANEVARAAKQEAKRLKKAAKQTADNAAVAKAIEEAVAKATSAVDSLKEQLAAAEKATEDRLATVEKMAAPNDIVRTAPTEAQNVAKARDEVELRIATLEREARETPDPAVRAGNREIVKELRASQMATK